MTVDNPHCDECGADLEEFVVRGERIMMCPECPEVTIGDFLWEDDWEDQLSSESS